MIIERFANITDNSILGIRAPLLKVGGNNQFKMMEEQGFLWDSSMGAPLSDQPKWPYTLDHVSLIKFNLIKFSLDINSNTN